MGDRTDQNWHDHGVLLHRGEILLLEKVKCEIIGVLDEFDCFFLFETLGCLSIGFFHLDAQVKHLHLKGRVIHQVLLGSLKHLGGYA